MSMEKTVQSSPENLVARKYVRQSQIRIILHNLRKNKGAMIGLAIITILVLVSCFADVLFDYDTEIAGLNIAEKLIRPCKEHWFGTDDLGRDIFKRVLYGARYSLGVGFAATMIDRRWGASRCLRTPHRRCGSYRNDRPPCHRPSEPRQ